MLFIYGPRKRRATVATVAAAVSLWESYRDDADDLKGIDEAGNGGTVYDADGPVARITYNGRVWDPAAYAAKWGAL